MKTKSIQKLILNKKVISTFTATRITGGIKKTKVTKGQRCRDLM